MRDYLPSFYEELTKIAKRLSDEEVADLRKKHMLVGGGILAGSLGAQYVLGRMGNKVPDYAHAIPLVTGTLGAVHLGLNATYGKPIIRGIHEEHRDPRLYRNIRNTFKNQKDRIADHKNIRKTDGTILDAMRAGFSKESSNKEPMSEAEALSIKRKAALAQAAAALGLIVLSSGGKHWYSRELPLAGTALGVGGAMASLILPPKAIQDEYKKNNSKNIFSAMKRFMGNREKYLMDEIKSNPETYAMLKKK